ncbi:MAG: hypothetical protein KGK08_07645 [Acidobacteriota bacterium]|nr:hypothetical protein [Acidobacteriota bacterium]
MQTTIWTPETAVERAPDAAGVVLYRGRQAVLAQASRLAALSRSCGQAAALDDLTYLLERPGFRNKRPTLLWVNTPGVSGAVLVYETVVRGLATRVFTADYHGAERCVLAPPDARWLVGLHAAAALLRSGALVAHIACLQQVAAEPCEAEAALAGMRGSWTMQPRPMTGYLPILPEIDDTLAQLGKHTRRNMRLYKRRGEADLGAVLVVNPVVERDEFLQMNRLGPYPAPESLAAWRFEAATRFAENRLYLGLRAADGRWLSLIGGRERAGRVEIEWQMNRHDLPDYSLSVLMRLYLLEYMVEHRMERLYFQAGTTHSIRNSMVPEVWTDLVAVRHRLPRALLRPFAPKDDTEPEFLLKVMLDETLVWHRPQTAGAATVE